MAWITGSSGLQWDTYLLSFGDSQCTNSCEYDMGESDRGPYIAMEYVRNIIHRDIKPGNIMYDSVSGDLKITDFGIARLIDVNRTQTGVVLGTPSFMSPEQIKGENVKGYTDLFALGVNLYELLTGQLPFHGSSMTKLMFVIVNEPHKPVSAVRAGLPVELDAIINMALNKDPTARHRCDSDLVDALRATTGLIN